MSRRVRKKRRVSIKKVTIFSVTLIFILVILLNLSNIRNYFISKVTGYKFDTVAVFFENDIYKDIKDNDYSQTLESIINTEYYNDKYVKEYINIQYIDDKMFLSNVSKLLDKGYDSEDINGIFNELDGDDILFLIDNDYFKDIIKLLSVEYFRNDYFSRYINYFNSNEYDIDTAVVNVNIGLDNDYYTNVSDIDDQESLLVLVNKYNKLSNDYVPDDLKSLNAKYGNGKMRAVAADAFEKMCIDAKESGIKLYGGSGYRSYSYQANLYDRYVRTDGKKAADTFSARAGYSEHQTGLAMDVMNGRWEYIDKSDKEYEWLIENSYKYGFILRYLEGKEEITGYIYEPWHYRYVGVEVATEIIKLGITYDEYVAKK